MNSGFEGLDDALDIDYDVDKEIDEVATRTEKLEKSKYEIAKKPRDEINISDQEYLVMELKMIIANSRNILEVLEQDIKIGTQPRYHEVYATLTKSVIDGLKELRELNQSVANLEIQKEKLELKKVNPNGSMQIGTQVNMNLTGKDLFKMIKQAKSESELNVIEADFEIDGKRPKDI
jgi:hypothetical protein